MTTISSADAPGTIRGRQVVLITLIVVISTGAVTGIWGFLQLTPKRFSEVVPGKLYRSGELNGAQVPIVKRRHDIGRIICLLNPEDPLVQEEEKAAKKNGVEWLNVPLRGNGESTREQRDQLRAMLLAPNTPPTLVHCAAGVNRTGLAIGIYRIHAQGWTVDQVLEEMRRIDFDDLPKHENLRAALREEAELAAAARTGGGPTTNSSQPDSPTSAASTPSSAAP